MHCSTFCSWWPHQILIVIFNFLMNEVINYTLAGVSILPVTTKIQVSFLTDLPERKESTQGFHHEANGDFKTVTEFNVCEKTEDGSTTL